jgi:hypothetical protein
MKFPITRERLQAFDPDVEKKEKDDIVIQNHLNSLVQSICLDVEERMSYGIPKLNEMHQQMVMRHRDEKIRDAHQKMMTDKRYIWNGLSQIQMTQFPGLMGVHLNIDKSILIEGLLRILKDTFIGCSIVVDPLKTYLIIDWS